MKTNPTFALGKNLAISINTITADSANATATECKKAGILLGQEFGTRPICQPSINKILAPFLQDFKDVITQSQKHNIGRYMGDYLLGAINAEIVKSQGNDAKIIHWYQVGSGNGACAGFHAVAKPATDKKSAPTMTAKQKAQAEKAEQARLELVKSAAEKARKEAQEALDSIPAIDTVFGMVRAGKLTLADLETVITTITAERLEASAKNEQSKADAIAKKAQAKKAKKVEAMPPRKVPHNVSHAEAISRG